ncbi:MAG: LacI family DNA-binding transcriptional regulator [Bacteroidota bacterium]|nr:LacI family DNA-binding transcriptional regulator [Bacteroidota bacterium]
MINEKEVTIYDIADKLKVSIATVSRALKNDPVVNIKTRKKIFAMAEEMNYRSNNFARNLRNSRTETIGVIVPKLNSSFMSSVIAGIEKVLNASGYHLIISQSSEDVKKEIASAKTMFNNRVDGLLVSLAYDTTDLKHFDIFSKKNIPVIFFDRVLDNPHYTNILIDNKKAAKQATEHLISQGCKRIVHITASSKLNVYEERLKGYQEALATHKIKFDKKNIITCNLSFESGEAAAKLILKMKPMPDGIFATNDNCAVGCMLALKQAGIRIPDDIAFVGFNNDPVSKVIEPNLTTINYPGYEMGEVAAQSLINHLSGTSTMHATNKIILRWEFLARDSSQKIKSRAKNK